MKIMENLIELKDCETQQLNGGGWLYDLYRIVLAEKDDFLAGVEKGYKKGIF